MKIIVNLICQNSEPQLPAYLESLKGRIDGIVAVDGGSTDHTVEVLETWGRENNVSVRVKSSPWPDDFARQRNVALNVTRVEYGAASPENDIWILVIDDDDTLSEFDRPTLEEMLAKNPEVCGLLCRMDNGNGFFNCCNDVHTC